MLKGGLEPPLPGITVGRPMNYKREYERIDSMSADSRLENVLGRREDT